MYNLGIFYPSRWIIVRFVRLICVNPFKQSCCRRRDYWRRRKQKTCAAETSASQDETSSHLWKKCRFCWVLL